MALAASAALAQEGSPGRFQQAPGGFELRAGNVRLEVGHGSGVSFSPTLPHATTLDTTVRYRLDAIGFGSSRVLLAGTAGGPTLESEKRLSIRYGAGIREIYEPRDNGVEQLFEIAALPPGAGSGDLVIEARITTALDVVQLEGQELEFRAGREAILSYGAPVAFDARGTRIPVRIEVDGSLIRFAIDGAAAAEAALPITIDPLIGSTVSLAASAAAESNADAAYSATSNAYVIVYDDEVAPNNHRIMAGRIDANGVRLDGADPTFAFVVTSTAADETDPAVAWMGGGVNQYLVVWLDRTNRLIAGRTIDPTSGALGSPFVVRPPDAPNAFGGVDIDYPQVTVGGREDAGNWLVVYNARFADAPGQPPQDTDVYSVTVSASLAVGMPLPLAFTFQNDRDPAVNRVAGGTQPWCTACLRASNVFPTLADVLITEVNPDGSGLIAGAITATAAAEQKPTVAGLGPRWTVIWENVGAGGDRDLFSRRVSTAAFLGVQTPIAVTSLFDDFAPRAVAGPAGDILIAWTHAPTPSASPTFEVQYARYDASLNLDNVVLREAPVTVSTSADQPSPIARLDVVASSVQYLIGFRNIGGAPNTSISFARAEGLVTPILEVREGTLPSGLLVTNGQAAVGATARHFSGVQVSSPATAPITITIRNTGGGAMAVGSPAPGISNSTDFVFDASGLPASIPPGGSGFVTIAFDPQSNGVKTGTVSFGHDATAGAASPFTFEVRGVGLTGPPMAQTETTSPVVAIPDSPAFGVPGIVSSVINMPPLGEVLSVTMTVNITHTFARDLALLLTSPTGTGVVLIQAGNGPGFDENDFTGTTFDDTAAISITTQIPPYTGVFRPFQTLSAFRGEPSGGDWTLTVLDFAGGDIGTLDSWSLHVETAPVAATPGLQVHEGSVTGIPIADGAAAAGGRAFPVTVVGGTLPVVTINVRNHGTGDLVVVAPTSSSTDFEVVGGGAFGPTIAAGADDSFIVRFNPGSPGAKSGTIQFTHNVSNPASPFNFDVSGTAVATPPVTASFTGGGGLPIPIVDGSPATNVTSTAFCVLGGNVLSVTVSAVNLPHTWDSDVVLSLVSPNGTRRVLSNGNGGSDDSYIDTTFTDSAATPIGAGSAPFTGSFRPDEPLAGFGPAFGEWRLEASDTVGGDIGWIQSWTLQIAAEQAGVAAPLARVTEVTSGRVIAKGASGAAAVKLGPVVIGQANSRSIAVLNGGQNAMTVTDPVPANPTDFTVSAAGFATSIAGQATETFDVALTPTTSGPLSTTVSFTHNGPGAASPFTFDARGVGVGEIAAVTAAPGTPILDLTTVTSTMTVSRPGTVLHTNVRVSITHTFDGDLRIVLIAPNGTRVILTNQNLGGADDFANTTFDDDALNPIAAFNVLLVPVSGSFRPDGSLATLNGLTAAGTWGLEVSDLGNGDQGILTSWTLELGLSPVVGLDVREGSPAGVTITAGAAPANGRAFGSHNVGTTTSLTVFVVNNGSAVLNLNPVPSVTGGGGAFTLDTTGYSASVNAGNSTSFVVRFAPGATGAATATVSFPHTSSVTGSPFTFAVSGAGVQGTLAVDEGGTPVASGATIDFGSQNTTVGPTATRTFTIRNNGNATLTLTSGPTLSGANVGDFVVIGTPPTSIPAGGTATLGAQFDPTAAGARAAALTFTHDGGGAASPFVLNFAGTGVVTVGTTPIGGGGGGGGGCRAAEGATDPILPALLAAGALILAIRRRRRVAAA